MDPGVSRAKGYFDGEGRQASSPTKFSSVLSVTDGLFWGKGRTDVLEGPASERPLLIPPR